MSTPTLSLIIATYNDNGSLTELYQRLNGQPADFEVIIVDQNDDNRVAEMIAQQGDASFACTHLSASFKNASRARNLGAEHARGEWLMFPDDDCVIPAETLLHLQALVSEQPNLELISGRTLSHDGNRSTLLWSSEAKDIDRWNMFFCISECTLIVRADVFAAVGGFDPAFGPGAEYPVAEGLELMTRLFEQRPLQARYEPDLIFYHDDKFPPWTPEAVAAMRQYGFGEAALLAKHRRLNLWYWFSITMLANVKNILSRDPHKRKAYWQRVIYSGKGFLHFLSKDIK